MSSKLVAFILGAGPNVGDAVAAKLKQEGYKVALGSRNPTSTPGYLSVKVNLQSKESVVDAFEVVKKELGPVNVVVYNGASLVQPSDPKDLFTISPDDYFNTANVGLNVFTAAQAAVQQFRDPIHKEHPKAFIVTGNILPFDDAVGPQYFTLGIQKVLESRLVATSSKLYEEEGIKFYFPYLVGKEGGIPNYVEEFKKSGKTHANVYWELISGEKKHWHQAFTPDGAKYPRE